MRRSTGPGRALLRVTVVDAAVSPATTSSSDEVGDLPGIRKEPCHPPVMGCMGAGQLDLGDPSAASGVDVRRGRVLLASSTVANEEAPGCVDKTLPGRSTQHGRSARLTHSTRRHADMNGQPMPACGATGTACRPASAGSARAASTNEMATRTSTRQADRPPVDSDRPPMKPTSTSRAPCRLSRTSRRGEECVCAREAHAGRYPWAMSTNRE
jgi:hypothetical protein